MESCARNAREGHVRSRPTIHEARASDAVDATTRHDATENRMRWDAMAWNRQGNSQENSRGNSAGEGNENMTLPYCAASTAARRSTSDVSFRWAQASTKRVPKNVHPRANIHPRATALARMAVGHPPVRITVRPTTSPSAAASPPPPRVCRQLCSDSGRARAATRRTAQQRDGTTSGGAGRAVPTDGFPQPP